ncbi:MAG: heme lyase CcmF/NrfE family subunit [Planctomycetes bacterium]|nr:heme lyase CcmF/NrfE family subunit [Planctomycetota bacterium]
MDVNFLGDLLARVAFGFLCGGAALSAYGLLSRDVRGVDAARRTLYVACACLTGSVAGLACLFLTNDYSNRYVYGYSEMALGVDRKIAGVWAGPTGSMLFWCWVLSLLCAAVAWRERHNREERTMPFLFGVLAFLLGFFVWLVVYEPYEYNPFVSFERWFASLPFDQQARAAREWGESVLPGGAPADGHGLNPQLDNYWMLIHPPCLYLGYVGFAIPFAYAVAALLAGDQSGAWVRRTRPFTMAAWTVLTIGITLGGVWAYEELGWGGYWGWDPVENASFIPWLPATALLHSVMIQERRNMFRRWNVFLVMLTFTLVTLGTYMTRAQVVNSVHVFGESRIDAPFLAFLALVVAGSAALLWYRWDDLRGDARIDHFLSRESFFLFNNVILLTLCGTILVFTLWEKVTSLAAEMSLVEVSSTMGTEWYDRITPFLFLILLILMAQVPLIGWRKTTARGPLLVGLIAFNVAAFGALLVALVLGLLSWWNPGAWPELDAARGETLFQLTLTLCLVGWATTAYEFHRGAAATRASSPRPISYPAALLLATLRHRRRYGGYVAHAGALLIFMGIAASRHGQTRCGGQAAPGETFSATAADGEIVPVRFEGVSERRDIGKNRTVTTFTLALAGERGQLPSPEWWRYHIGEQQGLPREGSLTSEPAVRRQLIGDSGLWLWGCVPLPIGRDLYVFVPNTMPDSGRYLFTVFLNPGVNWVWVGVVALALGAAFALLPDGRGPARRAARAEGGQGGKAETREGGKRESIRGVAVLLLAAAGMAAALLATPTVWAGEEADGTPAGVSGAAVPAGGRTSWFSTEVAAAGAIVFLGAAAVGAGFVRERPPWRFRAQGGDLAEELAEEKGRLLSAVREVEFEHASGKLESGEFQALRAQYVSRAAAVARRMDLLARLEAEVAEEVARVRARPPAAGTEEKP